MPHTVTTDVIVVGAGLAGLVATAELVKAGKHVTIVEQEPAASFGGQAWWSFGGLFLIDSPEQRRLGVHDSLELARQDWFGSAGFDRPEDRWPRLWAEAYLQFAAGEKRAWLHEQGVRWFPIVGWAERGGYTALEHGNSVPRFHITWGTGPGVLAPFVARVRQGVRDGLVTILHRHRVDELVTEAAESGAGSGRSAGGSSSAAGGRHGATRVVGVRGVILEPSSSGRGVSSSRESVGEFELRASAVIVTSGGIGGNHDLVRQNWPKRLGEPPASMLSGVPAHVDGRMLGITEAAGARLINSDRMWHYTEGITNFDPVWPQHGIRILPGPSSLWLDATGKRLPVPLFPGFDTLGTLEHILTTGYDHTWFVLTQKIIEKELALSGSEQNPDLTGKNLRLLAKRVGPGAPGPIEAFKDKGVDFVVADDLPTLLAGMQRLSGDAPLDLRQVEKEIRGRDREIGHPFSKDLQITAVRGARTYLGDKLIRVASPHELLDPAAGPLIAVKLHIVTRKTLGGIETDLAGRALGADGEPVEGLYAAGEASGFGGGGMHGYRALEGTFLGGCIFSGRQAGRAVAAAL
ncbi:FAD-binding dehydrogenase [Subtercola endophyticus]|uniref:FAD-binding dehydrogenase n=1 Tax=Subtercola endophyticus TaxID=2895559 RepID=UPI001E34E377|nr:FAD-binding dehydrogenase [Subtercola endophyticus]UFS60887.1 FAD-binding dehydrogenase [Subtercola endophyticus]